MVSPSGRRQRTFTGIWSGSRTVRRRSGYRVLCIRDAFAMGQRDRFRNAAMKSQDRSPQWREEVNALAAISLGGRGGELIEDGVRELFGVGLPADVPRGIDTIAVGL